MKNKLLKMVLALLALGVAAMAATDERPMQVLVDLKTESNYDYLVSNYYDFIANGKEMTADVFVNDAEYASLVLAGLNPIVIHDDVVAFYQSRFPAGTTMGGFPTLSEALDFMDSLHAHYPAITTARDSIGASYQGRAIWMMKISDSPDSDEEEPEFFINSLIHAREPMGLEASLRFMRHLCENYGGNPAITDLVDNREFYFVPVINPDGYEYNRQTNPNGGGFWRKNRNGQGTDLNRNWGYMWGYDNNGSSPNPGDETYRGESAFSEPETQTLREFINSRHFKVVMNFHTYGPLFLYPWGYINDHTPDQWLFSIIGDSATAVNGYSPGTPWELLYNTNGDATDWQYGEQTEKPKIFGFVMEIGDGGDGFWPDPDNIPMLWEECLPPLLFLSRIAVNPYGMDPPHAPVLSPIGDVYGDTFVVNWQFSDTLNPAVGYELMQMQNYQRVVDNFDSGTDNWILNGFYRRTSRRHSGTHSLFSGSGVNYNGSAMLASPVTPGANDTLSFWTYYRMESGYDYAYVQVSTDGGNNFINIPGNITTTSNPHGLNQGNGITGSSTNWVEGKFPLSSYAGQSIQVGLRYIVDGTTVFEGFYVDDFYPVETFGTRDTLGTAITDTFFTIAGRPEGQYYYQVRARDAENQMSPNSNREIAIVHGASSAPDQPLPSIFALNQNYPNPFNPQTKIEFSLASESEIELSVYDILGKKVATLAQGKYPAGGHSVVFDISAAYGKSLAGGVYFYRLEAGDESFARKMILVK